MLQNSLRYRISRTSILGAALAFASFANPVDAAQVWKFDFGSNQTTGVVGAETWNTITNAIGTNSAGSLLDLKDTSGFTTDVDFLMLARFSGENTNGTPTNTLGYPASATSDSLYGNDVAFMGQTNPTPTFKLASLDAGLAYDLTFYASRLGVAAGENRETLYTVTGSTVNSIALNVANNVNNEVTLFGVVPDAFGEIVVQLSAGPNNNNANHFNYLGVMTLAVPEPASAVFLVAGAGLILARRQRRSA